MSKLVILPIISVLITGCAAAGFLFVQETQKVEAANAQIAEMSAAISDLEDSVTVLDEEVTALDAQAALLESEKAALETDLSEATASLEAAEDRIGALTHDLISSEARYRTMKSKYESTESELAELTAFYDGIFKGKAPPWTRTDGSTHDLADNEAASDVTWAELVTFLRQDPTDERRYVRDEYDCSEFAEDLHNRAEAAGIRTAMVFLTFEGEGPGHALNAFNTTGQGLVLIDNTGSPTATGESWDRVAYVLIGERYGCLKLDERIPSFEYDHYAEFRSQYEARLASYESRVAAHNANLAAYNSAVAALNAEVQSFNDAVEAYERNPTQSEYLRLVAWGDELDAELQRLDTWSRQIDMSYAQLSQELLLLGLQRDSLGGVLGVVESVEMYW